MKSLDINVVRSHFPALAHSDILFDNAGGSAVLRQVAERISSYLLTSSVQTGATYRDSVIAQERVFEARKAIASLINAPHDQEVVMGGSTTLLLHLACEAIGQTIEPGDEIIVTNVDHEANVGPWLNLAKHGAVIKFWNVNPESFELELEELQNLLTEKTRWVSVTHASNILGSVTPVAKIAQLVHGAGAKLCVDGVAYAPHRLVDVQASGADMYVYSFYKTFGPHFAVLWCDGELFAGLPSLNHYFIGKDVMPYKLQPGNVNYELSYGCMGIVDYLLSIAEELGCSGSPREMMQAAFDAFESHENELTEKLLHYLNGRDDVRIIGEKSVQGGRRLPTVSFVVKGRMSKDIVDAVDCYGIGIRYGDFYAKRLIEELDLNKQNGVVRISMAHYNSLDELNQLTEALEKVLA
ncbi:cysteine desulfurase-like protein [Desulfosediminicola ganghwensis]|uniref:cysteine desulfurase-like protein n=1 Tax=Desulfosediminicola ganghwensis TaxID=2569540 RepID=UPI0010AC9FBE|nr:cysteine desulfurase-like protein [Desulfosediminicola ganghwensis]